MRTEIEELGRNSPHHLTWLSESRCTRTSVFEATHNSSCEILLQVNDIRFGTNPVLRARAISPGLTVSTYAPSFLSVLRIWGFVFALQAKYIAVFYSINS